MATGTNEEKLKNLKKNYPNIHVTKFQLDQHASIESFIEKTNNELDGIDILVNNAGITLDNLSIRLTEDNWKKVLDINLTSSFLMSKYAIKKMLKNKYGKIINITSIVGHTGNLGQANYAASKAGMIGLTKSLAAEFAARNVTVNAVAPGFIETKMTEVLPEDVRQKYLDSIPARRLGQPEEVASLISFLASDAAGYINGQVINVCGGLHR